MTYNFKTKPYDHQLYAFNQSKDRQYFALLMEMGTGKTKVTIDNWCYLYEKGEIDSVLVIANKGVYLNWIGEIKTHHWDIEHSVGFYSSTLKVAEKKQLGSLIQRELDGLPIMLINTEALATAKGVKCAELFIKQSVCGTMTIIDESTAIKNYKSKRTKGCVKIGLISKYRRILTGTPITQSPLDLYSQFEFLNRGSIGYTSFFAFKHYYADQRIMKMGNRTFQQITGYKNLDEVTTQIQPLSYRVMKEDCLDLPEKIYMTRACEISEEQKLMYHTLKHESLIMLGDGLLTSNNALTTLLKLHQITCGHVRDDFGNVTEIPNNRINTLQEIISETGEESKIIIWCNFQKDVEIIHNLLGKDKAVTYYGPNSTEERIESLDRFENDPECRFFIGTPTCGGKGLTLNRASYVIYYSNSFKLEDRLQSEDRCHRIGQTSNVTYIDIVIPDTIDDKVLKALKSKKDLSETVLLDVNSFGQFL